MDPRHEPAPGHAPGHALDPSPGAEQDRRFQIAHLLLEREPSHVAADLGVSLRTLERWVKNGVTWEQADLVAARLANCSAVFVFGPDWCAAADAALAAPPSLFDDLLDDLSPRLPR